MFPFLSRRIVPLTKDEFVALLNSQSLSVNSFSRGTKQTLLKVGEYGPYERHLFHISVDTPTCVLLSDSKHLIFIQCDLKYSDLNHLSETKISIINEKIWYFFCSPTILQHTVDYRYCHCNIFSNVTVIDVF